MVDRPVARKPAVRGRRKQEHELTFAERARREQLIGVTIDLIAENGAARTSLQNIADAASITKAAVLYHYATKSDVIRAAYEDVRNGLVDHVREHVAAAPTPGAALEAYLTALIEHLADDPRRIRVMAESFIDPEIGVIEHTETARRWQPLAELIVRAQAAGEYDEHVDARAHAIILGGAVDALTAETLADPDFPIRDAATSLLGVLHAFTPASQRR
ncbi:TetR family transcriptional regulator [Microbacterium sp.]|uniref:TetR/AcrR family transcriptional regulator n=1 Tax=Microbacterium sp. TaxID=51671 RepID=UPI003340785E